MKVYVSADMEGIAGVSHEDEVTKGHPSYVEFQERMTSEVVAACEGVIGAGASDILIKDAHGTGRNILAERLPACARLIRGWSGHPFQMVEELDKSFDAVVFVGYHSRGGSDSNPLAHTISGKLTVKLNGEIASEFLLSAFAAALVDVPVVFISGDVEICREAALLNPQIQSVGVSRGIGPSSVSIAPGFARQLIRERVAIALGGDLRRHQIALPERFELEIGYHTPVEAYRKSWYPGAEKVGPLTVRYESTDYFEVLRAQRFLTWG
jgi:D-amino peptidase